MCRSVVCSEWLVWCECFVESSILFACSVGGVSGQVWMCRSVYPSYPYV